MTLLWSVTKAAAAQKCKPSRAGILFSLLCSQRLTSVLGTKAGVHLLRARTACRHRSLSHTFLLLPLTLLWRSKRGRRVSARPRLWAHAPAALHLLQSRQHKLSPWHSFGSCACTASSEMEPACSTALHTTAWFCPLQFITFCFLPSAPSTIQLRTSAVLRCQRNPIPGARCRAVRHALMA